MYLGILFLCSAIVPGSFSNDDIHNFMSPQEIQEVFHTDYNSVPEYEIVKLHLSKRLHKRVISRMMAIYLKAFNEDINLWLHPGDTVLAGIHTPVYFAKYSSSSPVGVEYSQQYGLMEKVGYILEDPEMEASFVIGKEKSGNPKVNGYIGSKQMVVRSLPRRVAEEYRRRRRSVGDTDDLDSPYHVVYRSVTPYEERYPEIPVNVTAIQERISRSTSKIPDILYPEILSVVGYSMFSAYKNDIFGLLEYLLAFWNGVSLKYRSLESPKFRFHITAIILSEDPRATPYISNHSLSDGYFNSTAALGSAAAFYYAAQDTFPLDSYDTAVTITKLKFGIAEMADVVGKSFVGGACFHNDKKQYTLSVAIIQDNGAFYGIILTAHEMGHQFGSRHDLYKGDCVTTSGFVMAYTQWYTKNSSDFSPCSLLAFDIYLKKNQLTCLYNRPKDAGKNLPKLMPGRIKNLDEQCKAMGYKNSCVSISTSWFMYVAQNLFTNPKISDYDPCLNILCVNKFNQCVESRVAAVDGTNCGKDREFCLHMECVSL